MEYIRERLKEIFESTIESGLKYEGNANTLDYYEVFCKAASNDQLFHLMGNNVCMFNYKQDNKDAVMIIFFISINNPEESGSKNIADRVMQVVRETEKCFISLDSVQSKEIKEDKFVYVTIIKILNGGV